MEEGNTDTNEDARLSNFVLHKFSVIWYGCRLGGIFHDKWSMSGNRPCGGFGSGGRLGPPSHVAMPMATSRDMADTTGQAEGPLMLGPTSLCASARPRAARTYKSSHSLRQLPLWRTLSWQRQRVRRAASWRPVIFRSSTPHALQCYQISCCMTDSIDNNRQQQ